MNKKEYIQPDITVVFTKIGTAILAGSPPPIDTDDKTGGGESGPESGAPGTDTAKENLGDDTTWDAWN